MNFRIALLAAAALAACSTGGKAPPETYDFGIAAPRPRAPVQDVYIADVRAAEWLDTTDMLYRLEYRDPRILRPYSASRWAGTPAAMLTTRLRQAMGNGMSTRPRQAKCVMALSLSEFSQAFASDTDSRVVMHLHATLTETGAGGRTLARELRIERPAPTADAAGEAAAFSEAVESAADELNAWVDASASCRG